MSGAALLDGYLLTELVRGGAKNLSANVETVNDLNVFPIPDGDTGDNMLLTMQGGVRAGGEGEANLAAVSRRIAQGMLLGARGNSGVILSQFCEGLAAGFGGAVSADVEVIKTALRSGVQYAYAAVVEPAEGTILTVMRDAAEYACARGSETPGELLDDFIDEARRALARTPEQLDVLKRAGVVDSGGAGLLCIAEGVRRAYRGEAVESTAEETPMDRAEIDYSLFDENSVMRYGYCTELLLRLQHAKCDIDAFSVDELIAFLQSVGNSVVAFRSGTMVKVHVHTMTPDRVLAHCQQYGEFLTVKIENMTLQHSGTELPDLPAEPAAARHRCGIVAVAGGTGVQRALRSLGADAVIDGGQCRNPSAEDFVRAVESVAADTVFLLPDNGNVILAARQAAALCPERDVRVLPARSLGEGWAALAMWDPDAPDADALERELMEAMQGVETIKLSRAVRDADLDGLAVRAGDCLAAEGHRALAAGSDPAETLLAAAKTLDWARHEAVILVRGAEGSAEESERIAAALRTLRRGLEVYPVDGGQDIYSYILIAE